MIRSLLLAALLTLPAAQAQTAPSPVSATLAQVAVTGTVIQKTGRDGFIVRSLTEPDFFFAFLTSAAPKQPIRDLKIIVPRHALSGTQLSLMQEFLGRAGRTCLNLSGPQVRDLTDWLATQSLDPRTFGTLTVQRDGALDMNTFTYQTTITLTVPTAGPCVHQGAGDTTGRS
ncbi:hypothetical protein [Deinococcus soli (ex Cha et al. 2016)]|uniref:Uncharacterized protein n=2 Tax=Deinococcus soli (ex Cha et al. 2016) TaxID=1309411 RepID=A0AAE3XGM4_9DEIO|nr:hypothetical protein [Deinococcus soli (ex Cha et al. 2016)]MDR6220373.1 hypothetical protein [Deinococcus soli (ex Cha et al. 2016)]MDR6330296.1 hypothetical protein [Deinococcus soli (ex Cha et al. 2016)]MDR6753848.1 hypothetical protein [Deinococcus soli (ex Cha et al. 2016)]